MEWSIFFRSDAFVLWKARKERSGCWIAVDLRADFRHTETMIYILHGTDASRMSMKVAALKKAQHGNGVDVRRVAGSDGSRAGRNGFVIRFEEEDDRDPERDVLSARTPRRTIWTRL